MANNYTQFSAEFLLATPEQAAWMKAEIEWLWDAVNGDFDATDESDERYDSARLDRYRDLISEGWLGFDYEIQADNTLWVSAEESGDPEHVVTVLQAFLKEFLIDEVWEFTWANTCSKMRVGEFSGGEVLFTANDSAWAGDAAWGAEQRARLTAGVKAWIVQHEIPKILPEQKAIQEAMNTSFLDDTL